MAITNKTDELIQEKAEIETILTELSNPEVEEHVNELPINPYLKEFLIKLLRLTISLKKEK